MNGRSSCLQLSPQRIVIGVLEVIGLGVGISRRAHYLKIGLRQWRFISRQSAGSGRAAGTQKGRAAKGEGGEDKRMKIEIFQGSAASY